jgi:DMSO/TMAO reductase YedYZ molybdopterin-dependent catalytic subunit
MTASISRRTLLQQGGAALAGLSGLRLAGPAYAFPRSQDAVVVPWLDQPEPNPVPEVIVRQLTWEELDSWITPEDQFFVIKHFDLPELNEGDWRLDRLLGGRRGRADVARRDHGYRAVRP